MELYTEEDLTEIQQVTIIDGSTGYKKIIQDSYAIETLMNQINDIKFIPQSNQEARSGWRYGIELVDGKKKFSFTLNQVGDVYYDTSPTMLPIIEDFYKNIDVEEQ